MGELPGDDEIGGEVGQRPERHRAGGDEGEAVGFPGAEGAGRLGQRVVEEDGDPPALADAFGDPGAGSAHQLRQLGEGHRPFRGDERRPVGVRLGGPVHGELRRPFQRHMGVASRHLRPVGRQQAERPLAHGPSVFHHRPERNMEPPRTASRPMVTLT